jgi:hypothetical protein
MQPFAHQIVSLPGLRWGTIHMGESLDRFRAATAEGVEATGKSAAARSAPWRDMSWGLFLPLVFAVIVGLVMPS